MEGTTVHPIWSVDRNDWIQLSELQEGERLQAANGIATVVSIAIVNTNVPVYNIQVHGEHVYQVGELGLLVHNACPHINGGIANAGNVLDTVVEKTISPSAAIRSPKIFTFDSKFHGDHLNCCACLSFSPKEPFVNLWQHFCNSRICFCLLSDYRGLRSAEASSRTDAESSSFASHHLYDSVLSFENASGRIGVSRRMFVSHLSILTL